MRCLSLYKDMSAVDCCRCHETALGWASVSCWHFNCNTQCSTLPVTSDKRRRSRTVQFAGRWSRDRWLISVVYSSPAPLLSTSPSSPIILYCRYGETVQLSLFLPAPRHISAVYVVTQCSYVCVFVCHKSVFYPNGWMNQAGILAQRLSLWYKKILVTIN